MNTLSISDIFSNFDFYQDHYLSIISHPEQYYQTVEHAYINVWPVGHVDLYLGDLLQLWFSEKWVIDLPILRLFDHKDDGRKIPFQRDQDLYLYQLSGSALSGSNRSRVWSKSEGTSYRVSLDSAFKYYCIYKGTDRPEISKEQLIKALAGTV